MKKLHILLILALFFAHFAIAQEAPESYTIKDIQWDKASPASMSELVIPTHNVLVQGFMYKANGAKKHPTLILLHGYPGNERNLDVAQAVRAAGWNVIYFNYRGAWGSRGQFSFKNCVEDAISVVDFCKKNADSLQIDTTNIAFFGHSMGGWVCLKALELLPDVKKGFALSTWDISAAFKKAKSEEEVYKIANDVVGNSLVLNTPFNKIFAPVFNNKGYFDLTKNIKNLASKQIIMLDEHILNQPLASKIQAINTGYFNYEILQTDHSFTNKRATLIKKVISFLEKE